MKRYKTSLPVSLSFAELAWIFFIVLALFITSNGSKENGNEAKEKEIISSEQEIKGLVEKNALLQEELEQEIQRREEKDSEKVLLLRKELSQTQEVQATQKDIINNLDNREGGIRRELVGIKGEFNRVAIIFDRSNSMKESGRWDHAVEVVQTWLKYLPFKECVLIAFNNEVVVFPKDATGFLNVSRDAEGEENRKKLIAFLEEIEPNGDTNTYKALKKAYSYKNQGLDTIVLFTDGQPTTGLLGSFSGVRNDIQKLYRKNPKIPINTIGLGDYYKDEKFSKFLIDMAVETKGVFLGR